MSAKTGAGIEALVDPILLQAELLDLRAEAAAPGEAVLFWQVGYIRLML